MRKLVVLLWRRGKTSVKHGIVAKPLLSGFFRGRLGAGEYVVLKYQMVLLASMILLFLLLLHGKTLFFPSFQLLLAFFFASLTYFNYVTWAEIRKVYRADFPVFRDYTTVISVLLLFSLFSYKVVAPKLLGNPMLGPFTKTPQIFIAGLLVVFVLFFHWWVSRRYSREHTYGVVEEVGKGFARVALYFDPRSGVKPGRYTLIAPENLGAGDIVEVAVKRSFPFPFAGSKPVRIVKRVATQGAVG